MALIHIFYGMSILAFIAMVIIKLLGEKISDNNYLIGSVLVSYVYLIIYLVIVIGSLILFSFLWLWEL